jgi:hypothetical protein
MTQEFESLDEDDNNISFRRMLDSLMESKELIFTVMEEDIPAIKRNLTSLKGRDVQKLKSAFLTDGDEVLSYVPGLKNKDGTVELRITLAPRKGVQVFGIKLPDNEL